MFDPYYKWLGIPPEEQPPNHYRLLGLRLFEADPEVIDAAANRQMAYLHGCATGAHALLSQRLLNDVAAARLCLLSPERKAAYDARLKKAPRASASPNLASPPDPSRSPAPGVHKRVPDRRFPVLEGLDEQAEPYEVEPVVPVMPRRARPRTRKPSGFRFPLITSVLVSAAALLVIVKTVYDWRSSAPVAGKRDSIEKGEKLAEEIGVPERAAPPEIAPGAVAEGAADAAPAPAMAPTLPSEGASVTVSGDLMNAKPATNASDPSLAPSVPDLQLYGPKQIKLFNDSDLSGWLPLRQGLALPQGSVFRVERGELVSDRSAGAYLRTDDCYRDFVLTLEYQFPIGGQVSNSGSGVLLVGDEPGESLFSGIECQVMPGQTGDLYAFPGGNLNLVNVARRPGGVQVVRRRADAERPPGQWNDYEIRCEGRTVRLSLNGQPVNDATADRPIFCRIGLMCQASDVRFRNINLRAIHTASAAGIAVGAEGLQGVWNMTEEEVNGQRDLVTTRRDVSISGDDFVMSRTRNGHGGTYAGKIRLEPGQRFFDFIGKGPRGGSQQFKGIYQLDGDTLRLCYVYAADDRAPRPTQLRSYPLPNTTMVSLVLRRQRRPEWSAPAQANDTASPVGKWIESRPNTPSGDRVRTFRSDGILVVELPRTLQYVTGSWRREGNRIYFSHPSLSDGEPAAKEKWLTITSVRRNSMSVFMEGERHDVWWRSD